jgi:hypothetical protein
MGKSSKTANKNTEVTDDELTELENLTDLEDANTDEPEADEAVSNTPKSDKKSKKDKKKAKKDAAAADKPKRRGGAEPGKSRAAANGKIGTAEIAAKGNTDARTLRMVLRKLQVQKSPESNRYEWDDWNDKTVKKILKELDSFLLRDRSRRGESPHIARV